MMKKFCALALVLAVMAVSTPTWAQDGGGRQRGEGRRMQAPGGGAMQNSPMRLLMRTDVQNDLQLTAEQKTKLEGLRPQQGPRTGAGGGPGGGARRGGAGGGAQMTEEQMAARREESRKQLEAILTPAQVQRLAEISVQLQGEMAVANPEVQAKLGLSAQQKEKINQLRQNHQQASMSLMEKARSGEMDREKVRETMESNQQILRTELAKVLTSQQAAKLKELAGKPFQAEPQEQRQRRENR